MCRRRWRSLWRHECRHQTKAVRVCKERDGARRASRALRCAVVGHAGAIMSPAARMIVPPASLLALSAEAAQPRAASQSGVRQGECAIDGGAAQQGAALALSRGKRVIPRPPADGRKWCSACGNRWDDVQQCTRVKCGTTMCRRCYRKNGNLFHGRTKPGASEESWVACLRNRYWLCLGCCEPRPQYAAAVVPAVTAADDGIRAGGKARKRHATASQYAQAGAGV